MSRITRDARMPCRCRACRRHYPRAKTREVRADVTRNVAKAIEAEVST